MKLLLIGPCPPPIGGATVLFQQLANELAALDGVEVRIISTSRARVQWWRSLLAAVRVAVRLPAAIAASDVVAFHASRKGALLFGPVVAMLCRVRGRPWMFRAFGGYFGSWYQKLPRALRWLFRVTVLQADAVLIETRQELAFFRTLCDGRAHWYPNSRPIDTRPSGALLPGVSARRFVYIGQIYAAKGIPQLLAAARSASADVQIDVYGPLRGDLSEQSFENSRVRYRGILAPVEVPRVLATYDVVLLPTLLATEGHPGTVLEAFAAGIPVIASRIGGIPEILDERAGILVSPGDVEALADAINAIHASPQLFDSLRGGARCAAAEFDSQRWTRHFSELAGELMRSRRSHDAQQRSPGECVDARD